MNALKWTTGTLGALVNFKTGKLDSNAAVPDGKYPFFTCAQETFRTNTFSFDTECVLLGGNNANGVFPLKYYRGKFDAYQRTYVITVRDPSLLVTRFLYYALHQKLSQFRSHSTGAATKFLTLTILNGTSIQFPSLAVQRRIASILSAYDDLIEVNSRRIAILEEMAQRLFEEWFVGFRYPGHQHFPVIVGPTGALPTGWQTRMIGEAWEVVGGGTPSKAKPEYWDGGEVNWYTPSDLTGAATSFMERSLNLITQKGLAESSAKLFPARSIMMTSRATLGVIAINAEEASTNQGFITCIPNENFPLLFLYHWLKANTDEFERHASGATFKEITKGTFKKLPVVLPPKVLTAKFATIASPWLELSHALQKTNQNVRAARDLLLPKLISGEIDLGQAEAKLEAAQ